MPRPGRVMVCGFGRSRDIKKRFICCCHRIRALLLKRGRGEIDGEGRRVLRLEAQFCGQRLKRISKCLYCAKYLWKSAYHLANKWLVTTSEWSTRMAQYRHWLPDGFILSDHCIQLWGNCKKNGTEHANEPASVYPQWYRSKSLAG